MPNVTAVPRWFGNQEVTEFIDSIGTTATVFTFSKTQEFFLVKNTGISNILVTVGSFVDVVITPGNTWSMGVSSSTISLKSSSGVQSFEARGINYKETEVQQFESSQGLKNKNVYFQKVSETQYYIWIKPSGSKWVKYIMLKDSASPNENVWRVSQALIVDIPAYSPLTKPTPTTETALTQTGAQWEYAIKIPGAPDFFGGIHGNEQMQTVQFLVDGDVFDYTACPVGYVFSCQKFEMKQTTKGYDPTDGITAVCDIEPRHIFTFDGLQFKFKISWLVTKDINTCYAGMIPALRGSSLTSRSQFFDDTTINDISTTSHPMLGKNTYGIMLFNTTNNLKIMIEFDDLDWFNNYTLSGTKGIWIVNSSLYNKTYPTRILNSVSLEGVTPTTVWKGSLRYRIVHPEN